MIPTSPSGSPRGGGEVGITEAERSDRVLPGRRGAGPESRGTPAHGGDAVVCDGYAARDGLLRRFHHGRKISPRASSGSRGLARAIE